MDTENVSTYLLDNRFSLQQAQGVRVMYHNTIPQKGIKVLLNDMVCSPLYPNGHLNWQISVVGIIFGFQPTTMVKLAMEQIHYDSIERKEILFLRKSLGPEQEHQENAGRRKAIKKTRPDSCL